MPRDLFNLSPARLRPSASQGGDMDAQLDRPQKLQLAWQDIQCTLGTRVLLNGINGVAEPGRLLGLMGPSGSGKTTL